MLRIAPAVARKAAMESGVATRADRGLRRLTPTGSNRFVFRSGFMMKPIVRQGAGETKKRVIYSEGEDERVLRATQVVLEEQIAEPVLIGRPDVMRRPHQAAIGLTLKVGEGFRGDQSAGAIRAIANMWPTYLKVAGRKGVTPDVAQAPSCASSPSCDRRAGAASRRGGRADLTGLEGRFASRLKHIRDIIGLAPGQ